MEPHAAPGAVAAARRAWQELEGRYGAALPVPVAGVGEDGSLAMQWQDATHHVEISFLPEQGAEVYAHHETPGRVPSYEEGEARFGAPVPLAFHRAIRHFLVTPLPAPDA